MLYDELLEYVASRRMLVKALPRPVGLTHRTPPAWCPLSTDREDGFRLCFVQVTCCIDSHFTAFQVVSDNACVYYDPLKPSLGLVQGAHFTKFVAFFLLKCNYGDNQHLVENKSYYVGPDSTPTRKIIHKLWRDINKTDSVDELCARARLRHSARPCAPASRPSAMPRHPPLADLPLYLLRACTQVTSPHGDHPPLALWDPSHLP